MYYGNYTATIAFSDDLTNPMETTLRGYDDFTEYDDSRDEVFFFGISWDEANKLVESGDNSFTGWVLIAVGEKHEEN